MYKNLKDEKMDEEGVFHTITDLDENLIKNIANFARAQIAPSSGFFGGIICQEIVKYTGKYTPLCQWLLYETFSTCLPEGEVTRSVNEDSRYRDQVALFGQEFQQKL